MALTLVWKELRDQWIFWVAFALIAACGISALPRFFDGFARTEMLVGVLCVTAWGYGALCGALPLAGEREEGTQDFLDLLPGSRRRVWALKSAVAIALLLAQILVLELVGVSLAGSVADGSDLQIGRFAVLFWGAVGLGWGLFCSSFTTTVLAAIGWAATIQGVSIVVLYALVFFRVNPLGERFVFNEFRYLAGPAALAAAACSRRLYCAKDFLRAAGVRRWHEDEEVGPARLLGLAFTGLAGLVLLMSIVGALAMCLVALVGSDAVAPVCIHVAVICGIATFANQFEGDRRVVTGPAQSTHFWLLKALVALVVVVGCAVAAASAIVLLFSTVPPSGGLIFRRISLVSFPVGSVADFLQLLGLALVDGYVIGLLYAVIYRWWKSKSPSEVLQD
jgi:hypothetical protein